MTSPNRYLVTLGEGEPIAVDLEFSVTDRLWWAEVDGHRFALRLTDLDGEGAVAAELDGEPIRLRRSEDEAGRVLLGFASEAPGNHLPVRVRSAGEILLGARRREAAEPPLERAVSSPITGVVLEALVGAGDAVAPGQPLVRLEAMKMETLIHSPRAAVVSRLAVAAGDRVRTGEVLLEFAVEGRGPHDG